MMVQSTETFVSIAFISTRSVNIFRFVKLSHELVQTLAKRIASVRIHVERAIERVKNYFVLPHFVQWHRTSFLCVVS